MSRFLKSFALISVLSVIVFVGLSLTTMKSVRAGFVDGVNTLGHPLRSLATPEACRVVRHDGMKDFRYCHDSGGKIRCFADVRWNGGEIQRVWGSGCYESYGDCTDGVGRVNPCH